MVEYLDTSEFQKPKSKIKQFLFKLIMNKYFEILIGLIIISNIVTIALEDSDSSLTKI